MSRVAYVNGRYLPHAQAKVHIEDRGYQFADGVYEVCEVREGRLVDERRHLERLDRSLAEIGMQRPMSPAALRVVLRETLRRNRVHDGLLYLQVTRGVAPRDHGFPPPGTRPSIVVTAKSTDRAKADALAEAGVAVMTVPENRWERVDIKTVALLPNVLARQAARAKGAREAWFVDKDGFVTEGSSSNAWIVTADGAIVTRPATPGILKGITRTVALEVAAKQGLRVEERPFSVAEALKAREAFLTAATQIVMPVVRIDGQQIGDGRPGPVAQALRAHFHESAEVGL
ncbi:MAG: D-amino-acid transaminase [Bradyrhizobiaceae bacterium]|nr:D-amino-acid transaminase [Bradyrhizobiaceae bacterium]